MHKIKEMLHKDSDSDSNKHIKEDKHHKSHDHVVHDAKLHEKHTFHETKVVDGDNLNYKQGVDPTLNRDVNVHQHSGGITKERVGEAKIVKEQVKEVELHKVQPVIHRDREQKEIRHIVEPHKEVEVHDTKIEHKEKDINLGTRHEASTIEPTRSVGVAPKIQSTREVQIDRQHQDLPVQVQEHVHKKVEEHIHPVIYKEILKPKVTEETHHLYETVKETPVETYEIRDVQAHGDTHSIHTAERQFLERHSGVVGQHVATPASVNAGHVMRQGDVAYVTPVVATNSVAYDAALNATNPKIAKDAHKHEEKHDMKHKGGKISKKHTSVV